MRISKLLLLLALVLPVHAADISTWSTTASNNNATPPDGFPENMAPSAVNNAAREVMAAVRRQWEEGGFFDYGHSVSNVDTDTFRVADAAGDQTAVYHVGRRVKLSDSSDLFGTISASSYSGGTGTDVDVTLDSGSISGSLTAAAVGPDVETASDTTNLVTTNTTQTVSGDKTFSGDVTINGTFQSNQAFFLGPHLRPVLSLDADTDHDINVTAGAVSDSTGRYLIKLTSEITKQVDATFAVNDDAGGLNATNFAELGGSPFATSRKTLHVFLLGRPDGTDVDVCFDDELDASQCLADANVTSAGLTLYRRIGSLLLENTDNWIAFKQVGSDFLVDTYTWRTSGSTGVEVDDFVGCPTGLEGLPVKLSISGTTNVSTSVWVQYGLTGEFGLSTDQVDVAGSSAVTAGSSTVFRGAVTMNADDDGEITVETSGSIISISHQLHGWVDDMSW